MFSVYSNRTDHFEPGADGPAAGAVIRMGSRREVLTLILNGQGVPVTQFKIKAEIKTTDGTVVGSVDSRRRCLPVTRRRPTILFASDVLPLSI